MKIPASHTHISVPGGIADLWQCAAAGQSMADERVPAVMNGELLKPGLAKNFAGGAESLAKSMS